MTKARYAILLYIKAYFDSYGAAPTWKEIGDYLGLHPNYIYYQVVVLRDMGYVTAWRKGSPTTLKVIRLPDRAA